MHAIRNRKFSDDVMQFAAKLTAMQGIIRISINYLSGLSGKRTQGMIWRILIGVGALLLGAQWSIAAEYTSPASVDYLVPEKRFAPVYRFQQLRMVQLNSASGDRDLLLDGAAFDTGEMPEYQSVLNQYDAAIAYPVLSRGVNLDLGVNFRFYDGRLAANDESASYRNNLRTAIPMLYANALVDLPFQGFAAGVEGSYSDLDQNLLSDYRAKIRYSLDGGFGFEGGWQSQRIQLGNDGNGLNFVHEGPFLDLFYNF